MKITILLLLSLLSYTSLGQIISIPGGGNIEKPNYDPDRPEYKFAGKINTTCANKFTKKVQDRYNQLAAAEQPKRDNIYYSPDELEELTSLPVKGKLAGIEDWFEKHWFKFHQVDISRFPSVLEASRWLERAQNNGEAEISGGLKDDIWKGHKRLTRLCEEVGIVIPIAGSFRGMLYTRILARGFNVNRAAVIPGVVIGFGLLRYTMRLSNRDLWLPCVQVNTLQEISPATAKKYFSYNEFQDTNWEKYYFNDLSITVGGRPLQQIERHHGQKKIALPNRGLCLPTHMVSPSIGVLKVHKTFKVSK